jgi:2,3-bisphosphoglycerate-independent phosphoglycerate mutase
LKYLVLLGDGMADFPLRELADRTPLEAARTPAMDLAATEGMSGLFCPIPAGFQAGSDIGNLSCFGYDPAETFTGRAPLEAANQGIIPAEDQLVFRCNLVTLEDGRMRDFTADHITSEESRELIAALDKAMGSPDVRFVPGVSYRNLCLIRAGGGALAALRGLRCTPPHDIIGQDYNSYMPYDANASLVAGLMRASREVLGNHPLFEGRRRQGRLPATSIWLWGQGGAPKITPYGERFGISGAVVSAVDLVNGIGRCAGFEVLSVPGVTGYLDTNYDGKVAAALDALDRHDFAYVHVEAPDEAAHEGRPDLKVQAIEDFDAKVVKPCLEFAQRRGDVRILIAPDHVTSIASRTHAQGAVPFALVGPGIRPNGVSAYSERDAGRAGVLYPKGFELVPDMIQQREIHRGRVA